MFYVRMSRTNVIGLAKISGKQYLSLLFMSVWHGLSVADLESIPKKPI